MRKSVVYLKAKYFEQKLKHTESERDTEKAEVSLPTRLCWECETENSNYLVQQILKNKPTPNPLFY